MTNLDLRFNGPIPNYFCSQNNTSDFDHKRVFEKISNNQMMRSKQKRLQEKTNPSYISQSKMTIQ